MPDPVLVLFDDGRARSWEPFALTRPAGELRFGALTLRERAERVFGLRCAGHLAADHLATFDEPDAPPVLAPGGLPRDRAILFLSSRAVPAWPPRAAGRLPGARRLALEGQVCGWYAPEEGPWPGQEFLADPARGGPDDLPVHDMDGFVLERPWQLVVGNADAVARDIAHLCALPDAPPERPGVHRLGDMPLILGAGVEIEPGVVLDLREGPVWLDDGVRIAAFTRLAGPAYVGPGSTLLGGLFSAVSFGPGCKVHGEVEQTVILGFSNKAHAGFLGHAYLGSWVNLGALTANSDLKNNYGSIRLWTPDGDVDSGEIKLGCLLGDHVKTAIGTLLNTGTVVGAGANLFGHGLAPKYVPPFAWGTDDSLGTYALNRFLETAEVVMRRRNVELSGGQRELFRRGWERARREHR